MSMHLKQCKTGIALDIDADYCTRQPDASFDANIHAHSNATDFCCCLN